MLSRTASLAIIASAHLWCSYEEVYLHLSCGRLVDDRCRLGTESVYIGVWAKSNS